MPKIDPVTGCEVLTMAEFWAAEAEHEGKGRSGGELFCEMLDEIDKDSRRMEKELNGNALEVLRSPLYFDKNQDHDGESCLAVTEVLEIEESSFSQGFGGQKGKLVAKVRLIDGSVVRATWFEGVDFVTRMEPGNYEAFVEIEELNAT